MDLHSLSLRLRRIGGGGGVEPTPIIPEPGPMEWLLLDYDLTEAEWTFPLALPDADVGLTLRYTGTPNFTFTHGGEPLDVAVVARDDVNGIASFMLQARGLTVESAPLKIEVDSGTFGPLYAYANEVYDPSDDDLSWKQPWTGDKAYTPTFNVDNSYAGLIKGIFGTAQLTTYSGRGFFPASGYNTMAAVAVCAGPNFPGLDFGPDKWVLGTRWSVVGSNEALQHVGNDSSATLALPYSSNPGLVSEVVLDAGSRLRIKINDSYRTYEGPATGIICHHATPAGPSLILEGRGNIWIKIIQVIEDPILLSAVVGRSENSYLNKPLYAVLTGSNDAIINYSALAARQVIAPAQPVVPTFRLVLTSPDNSLDPLNVEHPPIGFSTSADFELTFDDSTQAEMTYDGAKWDLTAGVFPDVFGVATMTQGANTWLVRFSNATV